MADELPIINAPQQIGVTVEVAPEKAVDIDVSDLLDKVEQKAEPKEPAIEKKEEPAVEIEVPLETKSQQENEALSDLKAQLEALRERADRDRQDAEKERRGREEAERLAQQAQTEIAQSRIQLLHSNHQSVMNALAAEKADGDALERAYAQALKAGDTATAAKCQRAMARVETRLLQLEDVRLQVEEAIKVGPKVQQRQQPQQRQEEKPQTTGDAVEDYYRSRSPRVEKFLRSRDKTWVSDKQQNDKLVAAHYAAIADGYTNESDAYFDFIDKQMAPKKVAEREAKTVKKVTPAAPASAVKSSSAPINGNGGARIQLSARDREAARANGCTDAEWAKRIYLMRQPTWDGPKFD